MSTILLHVSGQSVDYTSKVFKTLYYNSDGSVWSETFDTINTEGKKIDLFFYRQHFYKPYYLPDNFIDTRYKNETLTKWKDESGKKVYDNNWIQTFTYDSISRVLKFSYSGCMLCSNFPYNYVVSYNSLGQPISIVNLIFEKDRFEIFYDAAGNINQLDYYSDATNLNARIILII